MSLGQKSDRAIEGTAANVVDKPVLQFELIFSLICGNVRLKASSGVVRTISPNPCATPAFKLPAGSAALVVQASSSATAVSTCLHRSKDVTPSEVRAAGLTARLNSGVSPIAASNSGYAGSSPAVSGSAGLRRG